LNNQYFLIKLTANGNIFLNYQSGRPLNNWQWWSLIKSIFDIKLYLSVNELYALLWTPYNSHVWGLVKRKLRPLSEKKTVWEQPTHQIWRKSPDRTHFKKIVYQFLIALLVVEIRNDHQTCRNGIKSINFHHFFKAKIWMFETNSRCGVMVISTRRSAAMHKMNWATLCQACTFYFHIHDKH